MSTPWFDIAKAEIGVREIPGEQDNPRIVEYQQATSLRATDDETPWCASFVNWCLQQAGIAGTNSAAARSFLQWGREIPQPVEGCIVVLKRGNSSWQGHVGFYVGAIGDRVNLVGGNQGNAVSIKGFKRSDVLGYRMPKKAINSKTIVSSIGGGAAVAAGMAQEAVMQVQGATALAGDSFQKYVPFILGVVAIGVFGFVIWERWKKVKDRQI